MVLLCHHFPIGITLWLAPLKDVDQWFGSLSRRLSALLKGFPVFLVWTFWQHAYLPSRWWLCYLRMDSRKATQRGGSQRAGCCCEFWFFQAIWHEAARACQSCIQARFRAKLERVVWKDWQKSFWHLWTICPTLVRVYPKGQLLGERIKQDLSIINNHNNAFAERKTSYNNYCV